MFFDEAEGYSSAAPALNEDQRRMEEKNTH